MGDHDPQQIVELDDAGDLAAEGVELGGRARLAPRRLGLRARARGERAGGDRHEHEEEQRHDVGGIGDGEFVERRQEEEVEAEHATGRRPRARAPARGAPPPPAPAPRRPARCWAPSMLASISLAERRRDRRRQHALEVGTRRARRVRTASRSGRTAPALVARRRHLDRQARAAAHQLVDHRAVAQLEPARALRLADHDPRGVARAGEGQDLLDHRAARHRHHLGAELLGQPQGLGEARRARPPTGVAWRSVST